MLIPHWRKVLLCSCLFAALTALGTGLARVAAKSATEAPAGRIQHAQLQRRTKRQQRNRRAPGDTFARDQEVYEQNHSVQTGLGPVYNPPASVAMRIRIAEEPASSQNSELGTRMKMAISSTRQSSSTMGKTRLPADPLSMTALSVRRPRSTYLQQKPSAHCAPLSTPWGMDLWKPLTIGP
jgi:hypothetical protein